MRARWACASVVTALSASASAPAADSQWVKVGQSSRLVYTLDDRGDRLLDFSTVGYGGGTVALPNHVVVVTPDRIVNVNPIAGDNRAAIQAAINQVAGKSLNANGFRGVVQLAPGHYDIGAGLAINTSGVILRGAGDGASAASNTILTYTGTSLIDMIHVDSSNGRSTNATKFAIVDKVVPVGATSFTVGNTAGLAVGDTILVQRPSPQAWIDDLQMTTNSSWTAGSRNQSYDRKITYIDQARKRVFFDAPLPNAIEKKYVDTSGNAGTFSKTSWNRTNNVGIENIRGKGMPVPIANDESHANSFIVIQDTSNAWVKNVTGQHLVYATVEAGGGSRNVTVDDAASIEPVSILTGGRRYPFNMEGQFGLMKNLSSNDGRHDFVNNSPSRGPNVFLDGVATNAHADSGTHQRYSTGTLWDNITTNHDLNNQNRYESGSGHGWAGANMLIWNSKASDFYVQSPPTAQNWVIGSTGTVRSTSQFGPGVFPGYYDANVATGANKVLLGGENSLYRAQLAQRVARPNEQMREYWVGDFDGYENLAADGDNVFIDPTWASQVLTIENEPIGAFDQLNQADRSVAFTFLYDVPAGQEVVGAVLTLAVHATAGSPGNDRIWIESATTSVGFSELGTLPHLGDSDIVTLEFLSADPETALSFLQDGKLNLLVNDDHSVDWANLQLTFAPAVPEPAFAAIAIAGLMPLLTRRRP
ncbi:MAG: hypothetical protein WBD40_04830 [Tepidisphaeraceae bacterium]